MMNARTPAKEAERTVLDFEVIYPDLHRLTLPFEVAGSAVWDVRGDTLGAIQAALDVIVSLAAEENREIRLHVSRD